MDERIKARYIDPMVDWSFKRLFGSEVNKDILIEFLKVIFPEHEIEDITYIPAVPPPPWRVKVSLKPKCFPESFQIFSDFIQILSIILLELC